MRLWAHAWNSPGSLLDYVCMYYPYTLLCALKCYHILYYMCINIYIYNYSLKTLTGKAEPLRVMFYLDVQKTLNRLYLLVNVVNI